LSQIFRQSNDAIYTEIGANQPEPGLLEKSFSIPINLSYGTYIATMNVITKKLGDGNDYIEGDPFLLISTGKITIDYVSIPLQGSFTLLRNNYFNLEGIIGLNPSFFMSSMLDTNSKMGFGISTDNAKPYWDSNGRYQERIYTNNVQILLDNGNIKRVNLSYEIGISLHTQLNHFLYILAQVSYSRFIFPIFKTETHTVFQKSFNFQIGLGFVM